LADLWFQVLKADKVSVFDNFFNLGEHFLMATQLVSHIRSEFDVPIGVAHLFNMDNLAKQAMFIETT